MDHLYTVLKLVKFSIAPAHNLVWDKYIQSREVNKDTCYLVIVRPNWSTSCHFIVSKQKFVPLKSVQEMRIWLSTRNVLKENYNASKKKMRNTPSLLYVLITLKAFYYSIVNSLTGSVIMLEELQSLPNTENKLTMALIL